MNAKMIKNEMKKAEMIRGLSERLESASLDEAQEIAESVAKDFANMNVEARNADKIQKFAKKIIEKENAKKERYERFLDSSSVNALIYANTQVGKTAATIQFIETCFEAGIPAIVSSDNKTGQQEQLISRFQRDLCGADVKLIRVMDKNFVDELKGCFQSKNHRFVIFCMDNAVQIEKLIMAILGCAMRYKEEMKEIKKIALFHDEADQITKDKNTIEIKTDQAASHKKWLELTKLINKNMGHMDLKRVFVSATAENTLMLYEVESADVIRLETPATYSGYKDMEYISWEDDLEVKAILEREVNRIKSAGTYEAILYCIERKIVDGHDMVLEGLAERFKCVINTYNGNGIKAFMRSVSVSKRFEAMLKRENIVYKRSGKFFTMKTMSIRKFYTMCKKLDENCVITIGKDLIARGISYVSEDERDPLTATTMLYKPGTNMHSVAICQAVGRITGCAMPSLKRKLYAPQDVIDTYVKYNQNQEAYIRRMEGESRLTKDVIGDMTFQKFRRNIDRPKLGLKMKMESDDVEQRDNDFGIDFSKVKKWVKDESEPLIGRMIKFLYAQTQSVTIEQFMTGVGFKGNVEKFKDNVDNGRSIGAKYGRLWNATDNNKNISLNGVVREFIENEL
jgi:hypothetical protein